MNNLKVYGAETYIGDNKIMTGIFTSTYLYLCDRTLVNVFQHTYAVRRQPQSHTNITFITLPWINTPYTV